MLHASLTSVFCIHSNVYGLSNIVCIRYRTAVDSILSTSFAVQIHYHLTSCSVEVPLVITVRNSSSIGKVPVPYGRPHGTSVRMSATSRLVSHAEEGITTFTNILQGHKTVVLVCCTVEPETDYTRKGQCHSGF